MTLLSQQARKLKAQAHHLNPVVRIGQHGISEGVVEETEICLKQHELIKVRIQEGDRASRASLADKLATATCADIVGSIGKIYILYREKDDS